MAPSSNDQLWSDGLRRAVSEAAPDVAELTAAKRAALWRQVEDAATGAVVRPRPRRWKAGLAGLVALGAVGVTGAATGDVFSAHTGDFPSDAEAIELGGPGEYLDPSAPDFAAVLDEVTADIRFPSADARERALSWQVEDMSAGRASTGALRLWTAGYALCSWSDTWAVALRSGDAAAEEQAAEVIGSARTWPAITDTDPDLADESEFDWLPDLEQAVRSEDTLAARRALAGHQACLPGLAPELGLGKRW